MTLTATAPAESTAKSKDTAWTEGDKVRLDAKFRCDRCGAQAYIEATLASGNILLFCSHDANAQRPLMEAQGVLQAWYSETARLIENRHQGSEN